MNLYFMRSSSLRDHIQCIKKQKKTKDKEKYMKTDKASPIEEREFYP